MAKRVMRADLRVGESLRIDGDRIVVTLEHKSGKQARLSIEADEAVPVDFPARHDIARLAARGLSKKD